MSAPSPEDILSFLTDNTSLTILKFLDGKEYSTQRIASKLGLPLSLTCRKVNKLEQFNIIKNQKKFTKPETDESFFTFWIDEIQMTLRIIKLFARL